MVYHAEESLVGPRTPHLTRTFRTEHLVNMADSVLDYTVTFDQGKKCTLQLQIHLVLNKGEASI